MNRSRLRAFLLIPFVHAWFALSPTPNAFGVDPPPDGGYPGNNTAEGDNALFNLDTSQGVTNTAIGFEALFSNVTADGNTAIGASALFSSTTGYQDTAMGAEALFHNTVGNNNTAIGHQALFSNTTAHGNTAIGSGALFGNTTGYSNTAIGVAALEENRIGALNTAIGHTALLYNTRGGFNTAIGAAALYENTGGYGNTAIGFLALSDNRTGGSNIALGDQAGLNLRNGDNNIYIANAGGTSLESATIRIGTTGVQTRTFIAGINGVTVPNGVGVIVGIDGKLGTVVSSARFKDEIKPMDKASEAILALKPVTFRYKHDLDPDGIPQFGLVAEDVEKINPDLVARDHEGKPYSVRYEAVNAMLLNEFLKEHRKVQEQEKRIDALTAQLKEQATQIQKVSAQLDASRRAQQTVVSNP